MNYLFPTWLSLSVLALGCGGKTTIVGESGGTGGAGTTASTTAGAGGAGGAGGSTIVPPACAVAAAGPGPHTVTFHFSNPTAAPLFLRDECHLKYAIRACADDYAEPIAQYGDCTVDCAESTGGCIQCGPCNLQGVAVESLASVDSEWTGLTFTFGTTSDGCSCHTTHTAPAAKYRITVPVYATKEDAETDKAAWRSPVDFELPAPGGVVDVALTAPPQ